MWSTRGALDGAITNDKINPMPICNVIQVSGYRVLVEQTPDGGYGASVPGLPGCVALGDTLDGVETEIAEAIQFHLEHLRKDLHPVTGPDEAPTTHRTEPTVKSVDNPIGPHAPDVTASRPDHTPTTEARRRLASLVEFQRDEWLIEIGVPRHLPMEQVKDLARQISAVVERWQPEDRDWDASQACGSFDHTNEGWLTKAMSAVLDMCDNTKDGTLTAEQIRDTISRNLPRVTGDPEMPEDTP